MSYAPQKISKTRLDKIKRKIQAVMTLKDLALVLKIPANTVYSWFDYGVIKAEYARAIHDKIPSVELWLMRPDIWRKGELILDEVA